jgi:hypothetical protein
VFGPNPVSPKVVLHHFHVFVHACVLTCMNVFLHSTNIHTWRSIVDTSLPFNKRLMYIALVLIYLIKTNGIRSSVRSLISRLDDVTPLILLLTWSPNTEKKIKQGKQRCR